MPDVRQRPVPVRQFDEFRKYPDAPTVPLAKRAGLENLSARRPMPHYAVVARRHRNAGGSASPRRMAPKSSGKTNTGIPLRIHGRIGDAPDFVTPIAPAIPVPPIAPMVRPPPYQSPRISPTCANDCQKKTAGGFFLRATGSVSGVSRIALRGMGNWQRAQTIQSMGHLKIDD